jgi:hypothetical protein
VNISRLQASSPEVGACKQEILILLFSPLSLLPYTSGYLRTFTTTINPRQQMHIEIDTDSSLLFHGQSQMRTAKNHQKLHRNYRSQIRADAERRRGAP